MQIDIWKTKGNEIRSNMRWNWNEPMKCETEIHNDNNYNDDDSYDLVNGVSASHVGFGSL